MLPVGVRRGPSEQLFVHRIRCYLDKKYNSIVNKEVGKKQEKCHRRVMNSSRYRARRSIEVSLSRVSQISTTCSVAARFAMVYIGVVDILSIKK